MRTDARLATDEKPNAEEPLSWNRHSTFDLGAWQRMVISLAQRRRAELKESFIMTRLDDLPSADQGANGGLRLFLSNLVCHLQLLEESSEVGRKLPAMENRRGIRRLLARRIAKMKLSLNRIVTREQNRFNRAVTDMYRMLTSLFAEWAKRLADQEKMVQDLANRLRCQEERLNKFLEEARKRLPEPMDNRQLEILAQENPDLEALYLSLENVFRGSREEISERHRVYLPDILQCPESGEIIDLGCGRGEWLELMRQHGIAARGIDSNRLMVALCQELGLAVKHDNVLEHLRQLPTASVRALTGFHIVEHLPFQVVLSLIDEAVRVLVPGGALILETPNPRNLFVATHSFHLDPTHRRPLPYELLKFLLDVRGLCRVEVRHLHPYPEGFRLSGSKVAEQFSDFCFGPQDYAVLGWKA